MSCLRLDDDRQHHFDNQHIKDKVQTILTTATIKGLKLHQLPSCRDFLYLSSGNISKENTMTEQAPSSWYDAGQIQILEGLKSRIHASVPGMYIGSTSIAGYTI